MTEIENKQHEMEKYYDELLSVILADGKVGLVPSLGPKFIECNYEEKSITLEFKVKDWQINPEKILFGGAMVSMLDNAYGFLCHYFAGDRFISTICLNTIFLKPGKLGDMIQVKVKADSYGRTIVNMSGEVYDITQDSMIGTPQTSFMILDKKIEL
ncbi:hypothetical protein SDC9_82474 [bioreactor metagenome]|uniref:Thioesterase domain-containing protein n=1 Tax=bioreactor metagenome TaxID=1076179 RepID=A0A644Z4Q9_9ZZZZ|nr:PaaI family thioesterase [Candidatus Metalachnospira sp.]